MYFSLQDNLSFECFLKIAPRNRSFLILLRCLTLRETAFPKKFTRIFIQLKRELHNVFAGVFVSIKFSSLRTIHFLGKIDRTREKIVKAFEVFKAFGNIESFHAFDGNFYSLQSVDVQIALVKVQSDFISAENWLKEENIRKNFSFLVFPCFSVILSFEFYANRCRMSQTRKMWHKCEEIENFQSEKNENFQGKAFPVCVGRFEISINL